MIHINSEFLKLRQSYLFTEIVNRTRAYEQAHPDAHVLRLGVGDVRGPLAPVVIDAMHRAVDDMATVERFHGYGLEEGPMWLRQRIIAFDYARLGISLQPEEVFISDGAGSDLGNLTDILGLHNRVAITDPVYPAYVDTNVMAGRAGVWQDDHWSDIILLPCTPENDFCPALPHVVPDLIYLCSPNNPTGTAMTFAQLKMWVDYARENHALIIFDGAYEAFIQSEDVPHSIYQIPGATECAIEVRSFSKTAGFTGVRCGYTIVPKALYGYSDKGEKVALNPLWLRRVCTKYNGTSYIAERAAEATLSDEGRRQNLDRIAEYHHNADIIRQGLQQIGMQVYGGIDSPYIWARTPDGMSSWQYFDHLLNTVQVVCTPGVGFGKQGEGFVRFSAFGLTSVAQEAMQRLKDKL
ncbi:MAG: LL-diaminopimelate aminotransferase [Paludibacteraceae bacterium]|nr:LL-diaminopimelate aminotransferase [Paludibacteraceae bacterium]